MYHLARSPRTRSARRPPPAASTKALSRRASSRSPTWASSQAGMHWDGTTSARRSSSVLRTRTACRRGRARCTRARRRLRGGERKAAHGPFSWFSCPRRSLYSFFLSSCNLVLLLCLESLSPSLDTARHARASFASSASASSDSPAPAARARSSFAACSSSSSLPARLQHVAPRREQPSLSQPPRRTDRLAPPRHSGARGRARR